jgi:Flp pilus assembly protein TadG
MWGIISAPPPATLKTGFDGMRRFLSSAGAAWRGFLSSKFATTAVEFGIIAPFLFAILFGLIGFGTQYAARIALTYAASEGGRAAVGGLTDAERESLARAAIQDSLTALSPLIDVSKTVVSFDASQESSDHKIAITIAYSDTRFAHLPFIPDLTSLAPVTVDYYVTDPSG